MLMPQCWSSRVLSSVCCTFQYGHITEVSIDANGKATPKKHYAMGRLAYEMGLVLPDKKTVVMSDDGANVSLSCETQLSHAIDS
jgi:hypothetical protein